MSGGDDPRRYAQDMAFLQRADEAQSVREIGQRIGYGRVMQLAQMLWRHYLEDMHAAPGGETVVGPCAMSTVPCGCQRPRDCDWCCGCGWLTPLVKKVKDGIWDVARGVVVPGGKAG